MVSTYFFLQTAYAKLLDIWLFFGLLLPFVAFILEVFSELFSSLDEQEAIQSQASLSKVRTFFNLVTGKHSCFVAQSQWATGGWGVVMGSEYQSLT